MTIDELIRELQKYPAHLEVQLLLSEVFEITDHGEKLLHLCKADALALDCVTYEGNHVLLQSV